MEKGKMLLGLLTGMSIGAIIGVLFAPDKGSSLRRKISDKGNNLTKSIGRQFDGLVADADNEYENLKKETSRVLANGKAKLEETETMGTNKFK